MTVSFDNVAEYSAPAIAGASIGRLLSEIALGPNTSDPARVSKVKWYGTALGAVAGLARAEQKRRLKRKLETAMLKTSGMSTAGHENLNRASKMIATRAETRAKLLDLFGDLPSRASRAERHNLEELLIQTPASQSMSPMLQKESIAKNTISYFDNYEYLTEAQRNFPELLKVSSSHSSAPTTKTPNIAKRDVESKTGPMATKGGLSGGSA